VILLEKLPEDAGLIMAYIRAITDITNDICITETVDNLRHPFKDFMETILLWDGEERELHEHEQEVKLFVVLGTKDRILLIKEIFENEVKTLFDHVLHGKDIFRMIRDKLYSNWNPSLEQFLYLYINHILEEYNTKFPRSYLTYWNDEVGVLVFYGTESPDDDISHLVEGVIEFWLDRESPVIKGKQIMINSYLLNDIKGRRIITSFPEPSNGNWCLLLEGGIVLPLTENFSTGRTKLSSAHVGLWTIGEVEEILLNPIYAYGYCFDPFDLFVEWQYVFLYSLATLGIEDYDYKIINKLYRDFSHFIAMNICNYIEIESRILDEDLFLEKFVKQIHDIDAYLKGQEETGISKNMMYLMRSRFAYLPKMYQLISKYYSKEVSDRLNATKFEYGKWRSLISTLDEGDQYTKGINLEALAEYFINTISGLKVTGKRIRQEREEIDILCCNVSFDPELWKLGSLILIECKNRKDKIQVSDIRNLVPIMESKGIQTALVFTPSGITTTAEKEIENQFLSGKVFICFDMKDILMVDGKRNHPYKTLINKLKALEMRYENDLRQFYQ